MASRDARDLESGVVASGVGPSDASDWSDVRWPDTPGSYGSASSRGSSRGSPSGDEAASDSVEPKPQTRESISAWAWRVGEPVLFWTACTAVAAFSMVSMVRMTSSPGYPSAPPQGHDDRSVQVGTIANSSEAIGAYRGCEVTAGGAALRDDKGTRRFPDFLLAGAAGAPAEALAAFLEEKQVACAGKLEASLRNEGRKQRNHRSVDETHESSDAFPTGEVTRRDDSASVSASAAAAAGASRRKRLASDAPEELNAYAVASSPSGALGWRPSTRWPSDDDGERFFADPRWRRQPAPLDAQKEYLDAHFHRCGESEAFLSVPRFQNTKNLLYTGWAPLRMCEAMGGDETRVVAMLTNPIDHAASVFAETLLEHRDAVAGWATPNPKPDEKRPEKDPGSERNVRSRNAPARSVSYSRRGFELAVDVDLHIARACGADGLLLGTGDSRFEAKARCCASAAAEKGFAAWPGCPGGCSNPGLSEDERARCDERGELGFSPARAGAWADHLRRLYERVPAQNVMVVTADQARRSGLPTLAVAVVGWRLLGLPLVDPVSVSIDLQRARARAAAAAAAAARVGEEEPSEPEASAATLGGEAGGYGYLVGAGSEEAATRGEEGTSLARARAREAYEDALLAIYDGVEDKEPRGVFATGGVFSGKLGVSESVAPESAETFAFGDAETFASETFAESEAPYAAALPEAFLDSFDDGVAIAPAVRARLASYHAGTVARLNALLGNGNIRWWDEETLASVAATQEEAFLETRPGPYGTAVRGPDARDDDRSAATGMTPFSSLVRH